DSKRAAPVCQAVEAAATPACKLKGVEVKQVTCSLKVAFAILSECSNSIGRCDARALSEMIRVPANYFDLIQSPDGCEDVFTQPGGVEAYWKEVRHFITRALDVILPPKGSTPPQQLRLTIDLIFDVAEYVYSHEVVGQTGTKNTQIFRQML